MIILLVTCCMLGIACVGAICRRAPSVPLSGFAIFGWIYIGFLFEPNALAPMIPTQRALESLGRIVGIPIDNGVNIGDLPVKRWFLRIGHCLCAVLFAGLGGFLGRMLFVRRGNQARALQRRVRRSTRRRAFVDTAARCSSCHRFWSWRPLPSSAPIHAGSVVRADFFVTCLVLGIASVGGLLGRGRGREAWLARVSLAWDFWLWRSRGCRSSMAGSPDRSAP